MRGTQFQKPWELVLELEGEEWSQGDSLKGKLLAKSHSEPESKELRIILAAGDAKKIKKQDPKAFSEIKVLSTSEEEFSFSLDLPLDINVSEKSSGVYALYGQGESLFDLGMLELPVKPHKHILSFVELLNMFFRFKEGTVKSKKGKVEYKLKPPAAREFASMDSAVLLLQKVDGGLKGEMTFNTQKLDYSGQGDVSGVKAVKKKLSFPIEVNEKDYLLYGDGLNQDFVKKTIQEILDQVKTKTMI